MGRTGAGAQRRLQEETGGRQKGLFENVGRVSGQCRIERQRCRKFNDIRRTVARPIASAIVSSVSIESSSSTAAAAAATSTIGLSETGATDPSDAIATTVESNAVASTAIDSFPFACVKSTK